MPAAVAAHDRTAARMIRGLYLATPLFAVADLMFGLNLRTSFLDASPALRWVYYLAATAAGLVTWRWPRTTSLVGVVESSLNIALTVLGAGLAYAGLTDYAEEAAQSPFTAESVTGLLIATTALIVSHVASHAALSREQRPS